MASTLAHNWNQTIPLSFTLGRGGLLTLRLRMKQLIGNLLVAQSGGPTAVINSSVAGVVQEARHHRCLSHVYGGRNGILGILNEH